MTYFIENILYKEAKQVKTRTVSSAISHILLSKRIRKLFSTRFHCFHMATLRQSHENQKLKQRFRNKIDMSAIDKQPITIGLFLIKM